MKDLLSSSPMRAIYFLILTTTCFFARAQYRAGPTVGFENMYSGSSLYLGYNVPVGAFDVTPRIRWVMTRSSGPSDGPLGMDLNIGRMFHNEQKLSGGVFVQYSYLLEKRPVWNRFHEIYTGLSARYLIIPKAELKLQSGIGGYIQNVGKSPNENTLRGLSYCTNIGFTYLLH